MSEVSSICGYGWDDQTSLKYVANHGFANQCVTVQNHDVKNSNRNIYSRKNTKLWANRIETDVQLVI
ncbi:hypothetical protein [Methanobrevibacter thaueri]|uniref:hypothetical protein n=1 Tax=Methanobrevibacter thaueri TaxID=190975 RepID=UPI00386C2A95